MAGRRISVERPIFALPRLKDWLALLGFEVVGGSFARVCAAVTARPNGWRRFAFMEAAGDRWWR